MKIHKNSQNKFAKWFSAWRANIILPLSFKNKIGKEATMGTKKPNISYLLLLFQWQRLHYWKQIHCFIQQSGKTSWAATNPEDWPSNSISLRQVPGSKALKLKALQNLLTVPGSMTVLGLNYEQILSNILENADLSDGWGDRLQSKALFFVNICRHFPIFYFTTWIPRNLWDKLSLPSWSIEGFQYWQFCKVELLFVPIKGGKKRVLISSLISFPFFFSPGIETADMVDRRFLGWVAGYSSVS